MGKFLTIDKFSGMEEGGIFWLEGFAPKLVGSKSVLQSEGTTSHRLSENSDGFSDLDDVKGMDTFFYGSEDNRVITAPSGSGMRIFEFNDRYDDDNLGLIHKADIDSTPTPEVYYCNSDIKTTSNVNILYSLGNSLGYGIRGRCKGTSTTEIVDEDGRNFSDLGIGTDDWNKKVYNLSTGEEHIITSITTTYETNDTLNFTAGTHTNTDEDYFVAFADIGADNGGSNWDFFETTAYPHFKGQESIHLFNRQIKLFGDNYLIGNGNYLASLKADETDFNDNHKLLPANTQFKCMDINQDKVLVGGDYYGKGKLMLWDGYSDGWLSILELPYVPDSIVAFKSGWVYTYHSTLYYTNGYTIQKLTTYPDRNNYALGLKTVMNGMVVVDDKIHILYKGGYFMRDKQGVAVYELGKGWNYHPVTNGNGNTMYSVGAECLVRVGDEILGMATDDKATNRKNIFMLYGSGNNTNEAIFKINLDDKRNIKRIGLRISFANNTYPRGYSDVKITASIGDNKKAFWRYFQTKTGSTKSSLINALGTNNFLSADVGDMLLILEGDAGGERTFVQSITNDGTDTETYAISPELSAVPEEGTQVNVINLQKINSKTIDLEDIPEEVVFDVTNMYTDNFYLGILCEDTSDIQIEEVTIYD